MKIRKGEQTDIPGIARVHADAWLTTYKGLVPSAVLEEITYEKRENLWRQIFAQIEKHFLFVAENEDGEIVGFIDGGAGRTGNYEADAEIYAVYILEQEQRRGVGTRLFNSFTEAAKAAGYASMLVWVLETNPAARFYERQGAAAIDSEYDERLDAKELAYFWEHI